MRFVLSLLCLAGMAAAPVHGQAAGQGQAPFKQCGAIADREARLACFDRALNESEAKPAPSRAAAAPRPQPAERKSAEFGLKGSPAEKQRRAQTPPAARPQEQDRVELQVTRATADGLGRWTIEAANGAAWRQTQIVPNFRPPAKGETVSVHKGALGGYLLRVGGQPYNRVERVR